MSATIARVRALLYVVLHPKRLFAMIGSLIAGAGYVWYASVKAIPAVKDRKTVKRRIWQARERMRP